jgi:hypothetical protein
MLLVYLDQNRTERLDLRLIVLFLGGTLERFLERKDWLAIIPNRRR